MEGRGLSVSECPDAWRQIARLGNDEPWVLTKPNNKFLHWLALSQAERDAMYAWGLAQGLVRSSVVYLVQWFDDEVGDVAAFSFERKVDALLELGSPDEALAAGRALVEQTGWLSTPALTEAAGYPNGPLPPAHVQDMLAVAYAEHLGLDGVFWNEALDVAAFSAPRAVISLSQLSSWTVTAPANGS